MLRQKSLCFIDESIPETLFDKEVIPEPQIFIFPSFGRYDTMPCKAIVEVFQWRETSNKFSHDIFEKFPE